MRGKISDQDLTNYALNDGLDARERLYVESMLAVSEECRQDVYRGIELAQMLEAGFEWQEEKQANSLTTAQRAALLEPPARPFRVAVLHRAAATLALAACAAFAIANSQLFQPSIQQRSLAAAVTSQVSQIVDNISSSDSTDLAPLVSLPTLGDEEDSFVQTSGEPMPPQPSDTCTPPSLETEDFAAIH